MIMMIRKAASLVWVRAVEKTYLSWVQVSSEAPYGPCTPKHSLKGLMKKREKPLLFLLLLHIELELAKV